MKNCVQCNHRFTFYDRLKTLFNLKGYLKCPKCNSVYKPISNIYRAIYYFLVFFISPMIIFNNLTLSNSMLRFILYMLIVTPILLLFDVLPHRWHKYIKMD